MEAPGFHRSAGGGETDGCSIPRLDEPPTTRVPRRPFIARGDGAHWPTLEGVTPAWLRERHGDRGVVVSTSGQEQAGGPWRWTSIAAYVSALGRPGVGDRSGYLSEDFGLVGALGLEEPLRAYVAPLVPRAASLLPRTAFWMGPAGSRTGLHADPDGFNLLCQVHGRKRLLLVPPEHAAVVPRSRRFDDGARASSADLWSDPELADRLCLLEALLEPGDVLYVPRWWWHAAENLTTSIALSYRCDSLGTGLLNVPVLASKLLHRAGLYRRGDCTCCAPS